MFPCFFAAFQQHPQKFARSFSFLVEAYDCFHGVASTLEPALGYPSVYLVERFLRQPELDLGQEITVNNIVYKSLKRFSGAGIVNNRCERLWRLESTTHTSSRADDT
jgi:hypothetical protein